MAVAVADGEIENFLRFFDAEMAGRVENPEQGNSKVAGSAGSSALEAFKNGGEILLAPQTYAHRNVHLGVQDRFFFQALHEPVSNQFIIVSGSQVLGDSLKCH